MAKFANNVLFTPTAGALTDWTVSAAVQGFMTPAQAGASDGLYKYRAESADLSQWEVGEGTYTGSGPTLTRTTILQNSAGTTVKINFSTVPNVGIVALKQDLLLIEEASSWSAAQQAQGRANLGIVAPPRGRLTLLAATPIPTTSQAGKTTLLWTPKDGDQFPVWNGVSFSTISTAGADISVATTDTTKNPAAIGASKCNDWFLWMDGTTQRLCHGPDWTNDTTRSAGTALTSINGLLVNNVAITNGPAQFFGTYVGTTRSNASSQLDWIYGSSAAGGGASSFGIWNMYNRADISSRVKDSTVSYTYASTTIRAANGSNNNRISFITGLDAGENATAMYAQIISISAGAGAIGIIGLAMDSITVEDQRDAFMCQVPSLTALGTCKITRTYTPGQGFHFFQALECTDGNTVTYNINTSYNNFQAVMRL